MRQLVRIGSVVLALLMLIFGYSIAASGLRTLRQLSSISASYAAYGFLWTVVGPAMLVGGAWLLACLGRNRVPLWIGGISTILAGGSVMVGVLTYVIPCSGPS